MLYNLRSIGDGDVEEMVLSHQDFTHTRFLFNHQFKMDLSPRMSITLYMGGFVLSLLRS